MHNFHSTSSSLTNLPVPGLTAAIKKKITLKRMSGSISVMGTPVSMLSWANVPLPVITSPIIEKAIPSWASRPTNSSFAFVNPKVGPAQLNSTIKSYEFNSNKFHIKV